MVKRPTCGPADPNRAGTVDPGSARNGSCNRARPAASMITHPPEAVLSENVYKIVELTGSSTKSIEDAVEGAVARAARTVRHMRWFQVTDMRGHIEDDEVQHWQVTVKIGFTLED